ncbi:MAG: SDR family oxidoreductase [Acidimicrobiia bacterium]|jgi:NAD(P)-dependent dehydrogenase (short-subunit alcohol dehydrogenase family)|nr:SDR family oxidoreductase [Acidimicrobiia bacterium]
MSDRRVTLVTGASQGIGRALALAFAGAGDDLVLVARNAANLQDTAAAVEALGAEALVLPTDITDPEAVEAMAQGAIAHFGVVDVLVNNSGIGGPSGPLWEVELEDWRDTFAVNVEGVFLVSKAILPSMIDRRSGSVIVVGSITGKRPLWGRTPYASTKAALIGLIRTLALEAGRYGVRVNLISPGFVAGPRLDWVIASQAEGRGVSEDVVREEFEAESALHRLTRPEDVAGTALFLASEEAAAITGADMNVNSGVVMY